ncbi:MAG TPA: glucose-1-phosphate cytidylyltransferase [Verrucomicrobiae bacterium]|jgi:glucose-1-phosphate cytidylyltransferase|nr:glucose-1-phosphate cytidylyltransferase [Verrucomicrobiae bacterium]
MKAVILAGGRGTRISEETTVKPKPMVTIGEMPILWHIMKIYTAHGINDFILCLGYKSEIIKQFFAEYALRMSDVTFDMAQDKIIVHRHVKEPWRVTLVNTGLDTATGGRLRRIRDHVTGGPFCMTYGDGLSDVNITDLIAYHKQHRRLVTMTVCKHTSRFGILTLDQDNRVDQFVEKPTHEGSWMNSGFYVMDPEFLDAIEGDDTILEKGPMENLVKLKQLAAFRHTGFFMGMDSMRDRMELEKMWAAGNAPWKKWKDGDASSGPEVENFLREAC